MTEALVTFTLPAAAEVRLCAYDLLGRRVSTMASGAMVAGVHEVRWDFEGAPGVRVQPGVYLLELRAGEARVTTRLAVVR